MNIGCQGSNLNTRVFGGSLDCYPNHNIYGQKYSTYLSSHLLEVFEHISVYWGPMGAALCLSVAPPRSCEEGRAAGLTPDPCSLKLHSSKIPRWFKSLGCEMEKPGHTKKRSLQGLVEYWQPGARGAVQSHLLTQTVDSEGVLKFHFL